MYDSMLPSADKLVVSLDVPNSPRNSLCPVLSAQVVMSASRCDPIVLDTTFWCVPDPSESRYWWTSKA